MWPLMGALYRNDAVGSQVRRNPRSILGISLTPKATKGASKPEKCARATEADTKRIADPSPSGSTWLHIINTICFERSDPSSLSGFGVTLGTRLGALSVTFGFQVASFTSQVGTRKKTKFKRPSGQLRAPCVIAGVTRPLWAFQHIDIDL